jgi:hypothetical protein
LKKAGFIGRRRRIEKENAPIQLIRFEGRPIDQQVKRQRESLHAGWKRMGLQGGNDAFFVDLQDGRNWCPPDA